MSIANCGPVAGPDFCTAIRGLYEEFAPQLQAMSGWNVAQLGMLAAVLNPGNIGQNEAVFGTNGKERTLSLYATQLFDPATETYITEDLKPATPCGEASQIPEIRKDYTFNNLVQSERIEITEDEWRGYCTDNASMLLIRMLRAGQSLAGRLNKGLIQKAVTKIGPFADGTTSKTITPFGIFAAGGTIEGINVPSIQTIQEEFMLLGVSQTVNVVGFSDMNRAVKPANSAAANAYGQDPRMAFDGLRFFADTTLGTVTGDAKNYIAFADGAYQMYLNPKYDGQFAENGEVRKRFTLPLVIPNFVQGRAVQFPVDYALTRPDNCDDKWNLIASVNFALVAPFADACIDNPNDPFGQLNRRFIQQFVNS
jgi:hypothetical protein